MRKVHEPSPGFGREEAQALGGLIALFAITASWWALALWPIDAAPVWLERTRYVCFGVTRNGLPDRGGWIGLVGGPLGMLLILSVGWSSGLRNLWLSVPRSRALTSTVAMLVLGCVALVITATARVQQVRASEAWLEPEPPIPSVDYPRLDTVAPPLILTSQSGEAVDLARLGGSPVLVTFAYAHCTTICPLVVTQTLNAQAKLRGTRDEPRVLIVTLDPWRDTPSRLPAMAASWGLPDTGAWVLSGNVQEVSAVLDGWGVPHSRDSRTGEVTHPSVVYIIAPDGRLSYAATGGTDAIVSLIRRL